MNNSPSARTPSSVPTASTVKKGFCGSNNNLSEVTRDNKNYCCPPSEMFKKDAGGRSIAPDVTKCTMK